MKKAGGIIVLISGIGGILFALLTLMIGIVAEVSEAPNAHGVLLAAVLCLGVSSTQIIYGAMSLNGAPKTGTHLLIVSILGVFGGNVLTLIFSIMGITGSVMIRKVEKKLKLAAPPVTQPV